eukprot:6199664-Pleurochrysis_carterae.AAC.1
MLDPPEPKEKARAPHPSPLRPSPATTRPPFDKAALASHRDHPSRPSHARPHVRVLENMACRKSSDAA